MYNILLENKICEFSILFQLTRTGSPQTGKPGGNFLRIKASRRGHAAR